jgi:hypothetical protein
MPGRARVSLLPETRFSQAGPSNPRVYVMYTPRPHGATLLARDGPAPAVPPVNYLTWAARAYDIEGGSAGEPGR